MHHATCCVDLSKESSHLVPHRTKSNVTGCPFPWVYSEPLSPPRNAKVTPQFRTRAKVRWDDHFLYVAAQVSPRRNVTPGPSCSSLVSSAAHESQRVPDSREHLSHLATAHTLHRWRSQMCGRISPCTIKSSSTVRTPTSNGIWVGSPPLSCITNPS